MIALMKRRDALLAIYGLLFLLTGELLHDSYLGWSAMFTSAGFIAIALVVCRMVIDRIGL